MTFAHASNAIAGSSSTSSRSQNSPWDRFLAGNDAALTMQQLDGAQTFLTLKCSICHNGATFSDEQFHDVAVAQIGPGEGNGIGLRDDFGRMNVTGLAEDRYRFRTTPLRNVELTGPYGHDGAITSLREFVEHYSESDLKLLAFDPTRLEPALRVTLVNNTARRSSLQRDTLLAGVVLTDDARGQADGLHERPHRRRGARSLALGAGARAEQVPWTSLILEPGEIGASSRAGTVALQPVAAHRACGHAQRVRRSFPRPCRTPFPHSLIPSSPPHCNGLTQIFRKLIGGLGSPCACSMIGAGPCAVYFGRPMYGVWPRSWKWFCTSTPLCSAVT